MFAIRLSRSYEECKDFLADLADKSEAMVVYEHADNVERVHIHGLLVFNRKEDTLRNKFKCFEKTDWSLKAKWKGGTVNEGFIAYMSKGVYEPKYVKGFSQDVIDFQKSKGYKKEDFVEKEFKQGKNKLTKYEIIQLVRVRILEKHDSYYAKNLMDVIKDVLVEQKQCLGVYKAVDLYDAYRMHFDGASFVSDCMRIIERREKC